MQNLIGELSHGARALPIFAPMKSIFLWILLLSMAGNLSAQYRDTVWTIKGQTVLDERFKKWKPDFVIDARTSTVDSRRARILGFRLGAEYKRVHRFGLGVYGVSTDVPSNRFEQIGPNVDSASFTLEYTSLFYERVLLLHRKWEWSAAVHAGIGEVKVDYLLQDDPDIYNLSPITVRPTELSTSGYYNITWWLSAGGGIGWRFMRKSPPEIREAYNGGIYIAKVKIKFAKLVRRIWDKSVCDEY